MASYSAFHVRASVAWIHTFPHSAGSTLLSELSVYHGTVLSWCLSNHVQKPLGYCGKAPTGVLDMTMHDTGPAYSCILHGPCLDVALLRVWGLARRRTSWKQRMRS